MKKDFEVKFCVLSEEVEENKDFDTFSEARSAALRLAKEKRCLVFIHNQGFYKGKFCDGVEAEVLRISGAELY